MILRIGPTTFQSSKCSRSPLLHILQNGPCLKEAGPEKGCACEESSSSLKFPLVFAISIKCCGEDCHGKR